MSDNHGKDEKKSGGGIKMDIGITSMISGFFGVASGAGAVQMYKDGGWGGGHDHH
jgi:hypothetical protein